MHTYIHIYIHTYIHACIHTHIHTYAHTYIHTNLHMILVMDGWMDGWWDGWVNGWVNGCMEGVDGLVYGWADWWIDGRLDGCMEAVDGLIDGWIDGWVDGLMNGWMDGCMEGVDELIDGWVDRWMDWWMDGWSEHSRWMEERADERWWETKWLIDRRTTCVCFNQRHLIDCRGDPGQYRWSLVVSGGNLCMLPGDWWFQSTCAQVSALWRCPTHRSNYYRVAICKGRLNIGPNLEQRFSYFHSFIHSGHFYTAPSSPLLLRGAPDYSTDTVSEFHAEAHRQL